MALALILALACTAGPALLPQAGRPRECSFAPVAAPVGSERHGPELGRIWIRQTDSDEVRWIDPVSLKPASAPAVPIGEQTSVWTLAPDGNLLALGGSRRVWIVDVDRMAVIEALRANGWVLAWVSRHRLVAASGHEAVMFDAARGGHVESFDLEGEVVASQQLPGSLVLLVAPRYRTNVTRPSRLVTIDASGEVRSVMLDRVDAGFDPHRSEYGLQITPGLAVDPAGQAFVVQADGPVGQIDLEEMDVSYHELANSSLERVASSIVPPAEAKLSAWSAREALWLGDGRIAVTGRDGDAASGSSSAAGLTIIDTNSWTACLVEEGPEDIALEGRTLLAAGDWSARHDGFGLVAYDLAGNQRWRLFPGRGVDLQTAGGFAYATTSWSGWKTRIVDVSTGRLVNVVKRRAPTLLVPGETLRSD